MSNNSKNTDPKKIKIAYVSGSSKKIDSVRGIGANNSELFVALNKYKGKNIEITDEESTNIKNYDVVHFTVFRPFFISLPFFKPKNQKWILTIHDLIPLIYPKYYPSGLKGFIKYQINKFLIKLYVDKIITISQTSKKDICRFLNVDPRIVDVVYISAKQAITKLNGESWKKEIIKKFNLPSKFIIFDHGVNYNKNLITLIKASIKINMPVAAVGKEIENLGKFNLGNTANLKGPLDRIRNLFGIQHPQLQHLEELEKVLNESKTLRLGYVSDEDLNKLFNLATLCVQPSYYEGFGMPVVEAMKVGTPVVASKTQTLVEIGQDACLYFDPKSSNDLAEKIKLILNDKKVRDELIKLGYKQAQKYSWEKCAKETLSLYEKIV